MKADFEINNCGSIIMFIPMNDGAKDWLESNTDGMWFGGGLAVEPRYSEGLIQGIQEEGFTI